MQLTLDEFMDTPLSLRSRGLSISASGGVSQTPTVKWSGIVAFQPLFGQRLEIAGQPEMQADYKAFTQDLTVGAVNGDIATVAGVDYEVVWYGLNSNVMVGSYYVLYLRTLRA